MISAIVGGICLILVVALALTCVLGSRARARQSGQYPPPGRMVDVSGHYIHVEQPEVVINAIREVVEAAGA